MAGRLFNLAKMNTATSGTGTITLSTAVSGFLSFSAAGVTNGQSVTYIIEDGASRELGVGTYTSSGTTLTRSVIKSTNSDNAVNLSGSATVGITAAAENFSEWNSAIDANGFNIGFDDNTGINDDSGNESVRFRKTSSAVNYIEILNTETTVGPAIGTAGDDTNIDLNLTAKGSGVVKADGVEVVTLTGTQTLTNKTLTTPTLGAASATSINKVAITAPATSATLTISDGKTLAVSNSLTLAGTDSTTLTFPGASASVGYLDIPQNSQSAAYTLVLADAGKHILHPSSDNNARTFTIPANSIVAYPVGTAITFINAANTLTIAITTDTMYLAGAASTTGSRTLAAYGIATAVKIASTTWVISGTNLS